jgi:serine/threonine protein phosphatase PrpC
MSETRPALSLPTRASLGPIPKPPDSQLDVYGLTHQGKVRSENQDHFLLCQLNKQIQVHFTSLPDVGRMAEDSERLAFLAMVADGVGGSARGEEASRLAVAAITRYVAGAISSYYASDPDDEDAFGRALAAAATRCHEDLLRRSAEDPEHPEMATTLTLFIGVWPNIYLVQVGDSRYYLLKPGELVQVSRDQTIAQELVDQGVFSPAQAAGTPWAHTLSSAIGGASAHPVVTRIVNDLSYVHLLCSDGLTRHVSDARIAEHLRTMTSARQACEALLQDALDGGGSDNITILVGRARTT